MELGRRMPGGEKCQQRPEDGVDHLRFLPVGSVWGYGDQAENKPDLGLGEIISKPLQAMVWSCRLV